MCVFLDQLFSLAAGDMDIISTFILELRHEKEALVLWINLKWIFLSCFKYLACTPDMWDKSALLDEKNEKKEISTLPTEELQQSKATLKEKFGLFVDFEFLTEMGSWGTD